MKKIVWFTALFLLIVVLTKIANEAPPAAMPGIAFSLRAQRVVECAPDEITLMDNHQAQTHLTKDPSWPACSTFGAGQAFDFYLSRGERTGFVRVEPTSWWREGM